MSPTDKADDLWRKLILARDKHRCRCCGAGAVDAAHIRRRGLRATRWLARNGLALCRECHDRFHRYPKAAQEFYRRCLGDDEYEELVRLSWGTPVRAEDAIGQLTEALL